MKEGITAYIIENNLKIRKVTVAHITSNMALVKFDEGGGIRVRLDRLFDSEEAARRYLGIKGFVHDKYNGQLMWKYKPIISYKKLYQQLICRQN